MSSIRMLRPDSPHEPGHDPRGRGDRHELTGHPNNKAQLAQVETSEAPTLRVARLALPTPLCYSSH